MTGACPMLDTTTRVLREQPCKGHIYTLAGKGIGHDVFQHRARIAGIAAIVVDMVRVIRERWGHCGYAAIIFS